MNEDKKNKPELKGKEAIIPLLLALVVFAILFLG